MTTTEFAPTSAEPPGVVETAPGERTFARVYRRWCVVMDDGWRQASPQNRTRVQMAAFLVVVVGAYHYSLQTLLQSLNLDTPLAYVGLVPFIALGLAAVRSRPTTTEPAIHDRQVDYIIGVPLLLTALAINELLPRRMSAMFWVWRIDLLSLPFFVAGAASIIFGVRALWRQRLAVAYLLLAWPLPYTALLLGQLNAITAMTLRGLRTLVSVVHVGVVAPFSDGSLFNIVHHGRTFQLSVVSACSGVNGMVGFLLVGTAFGAIVRGPRLRKSLWLAGGMLLLWVINLGRLLLIFWVGQEFGEHIAIKVLHPFVGLVTFNIGIVVMLFLLKPAGLKIGGRLSAEPPMHAASSAGTGGAVDPSPLRVLPLAVPKVYGAVALVALLAMLIGTTNAHLKTYDLVARADGEPRLASYLAYPASPAGWSATFSTQYDWAKPFFGESSSWYRYDYLPSVSGSDLLYKIPVVADVINTNDLSSFSAYGVEACYRFHGYSLRSVTQVSLGGGITGQTLSYSSPRFHQDWSIIYWIWPVKNGNAIRYERVILYVLDSGFGAVNSPGSSSTKLQAVVNVSGQTQRQADAERGFLVAFARQVIKAQASVPPGAQMGRNMTEVKNSFFKKRPAVQSTTTGGLVPKP